jgi:hypothetical protein
MHCSVLRFGSARVVNAGATALAMSNTYANKTPSDRHGIIGIVANGWQPYSMMLCNGLAVCRPSDAAIDAIRPKGKPVAHPVGDQL